MVLKVLDVSGFSVVVDSVLGDFVDCGCRVGIVHGIHVGLGAFVYFVGVVYGFHVGLGDLVVFRVGSEVKGSGCFVVFVFSVGNGHVIHVGFGFFVV